jgi:hypothetical protein
MFRYVTISIVLGLLSATALAPPASACPSCIVPLLAPLLGAGAGAALGGGGDTTCFGGAGGAGGNGGNGGNSGGGVYVLSPGSGNGGAGGAGGNGGAGGSCHTE